MPTQYIYCIVVSDCVKLYPLYRQSGAIAGVQAYAITLYNDVNLCCQTYGNALAVESI